MERTAWTDERGELFQLKLVMLGGLVTILAAVVALHG
jgi:hypothetical protein